VTKSPGWNIPSVFNEITTRSKGAGLISPLVSDRDVKKHIEERRGSSSSLPETDDQTKLRQQVDYLLKENLKLREEREIFEAENENLKEKGTEFDQLQEQFDQLTNQNLQLQELLQNLNQNDHNQMAANVPILDNVLTPKIFSGDGEDDATEWIEFFENYAKFRRLDYDDVKQLIPLFLKNSAKEWWRGLVTSNGVPANLDALVTAFKAKFKPSGVARWKSRAELWKRQQRADEKVGPYVESMKAIGKRLEMDEETIMWSIINGLRDDIRPSVIEHNLKNLDELKIHAELAESARSNGGGMNLESAIRRIESRLDTLAVSSVSNSSLPVSGLEKSRWFGPRRGPGNNSEEPSRYQRRDQARPRNHGDERRKFSGRRNQSPTNFSNSRRNCSACGRVVDGYHRCRAMELECFQCRTRGHVRRTCPELNERRDTGRTTTSPGPRRSRRRTD